MIAGEPTIPPGPHGPAGWWSPTIAGRGGQSLHQLVGHLGIPLQSRRADYRPRLTAADGQVFGHDASRALVLGSGGITGVSWEIGLVAGLATQGVDLSAADLMVGTSAGALAGAQLTSAMAWQRCMRPSCAPAERRGHRGHGPRSSCSATAWRCLHCRGRPPGRAIRLGRAGLRLPAAGRGRPPRGDRGWLPSHEWPAQRLLLAAVDVDDGGVLRTFDAASGASLIEAVSASCAVPGCGRRW